MAVGRLDEHPGNRRDAVAQNLVRPPVVDKDAGAGDDLVPGLNQVEGHGAAAELACKKGDQPLVRVAHEARPIETAFPDHPNVKPGKSRKQSPQIVERCSRAA